MREKFVLTLGEEPDDESGDAAGVAARLIQVDGKLDENRVAFLGERDELVLLAGGGQDRHAVLSLPVEGTRWRRRGRGRRQSGERKETNWEVGGEDGVEEGDKVGRGRRQSG